MIRINTKLIAVFVVCAIVAHACASDIRYTVTDLGVIGSGPESFPTAMNNLGEVVGYADTYTNYAHAFLWNGSGPLINLGSFGGDSSLSVATAINDQGMVVGYSDSSGAGNDTRGFLYTGNGPMKDLGTLGGPDTQACDINNSGQIVGVSQLPNGTYDGFLYSGHGPMVDLGPYRAILINNAGQIAAVTGPAGSIQAYMSSGGTGSWVPIGSLGGPETCVYGMNNLGAVVGFSTTSASGAYNAFVYSGGTMTDLGTFGGLVSCANSVNDQGVVVGYADYPGGQLDGRAFIYYGSGSIEDLNNLIDPSSGWTIDVADAINDRGQIAAEGYYQGSGDAHAVLLTPIAEPEPSTLWLLVAAGCFSMIIGNYNRWRLKSDFYGSRNSRDARQIIQRRMESCKISRQQCKQPIHDHAQRGRGKQSRRVRWRYSRR